jgi:hypothetical protein
MQLLEQNCFMPVFQSMGHRAWFAWHALPRDDRGNPPKLRELEREHELPNGSLYKLIWGVLVRPGLVQLVKMAAALGTTPEWLQLERGAAPKASWPVVPRPDPPAGAAARVPGPRALSEDAERAHARKARDLLDRGNPRRTRNTRK